MGCRRLPAVYAGADGYVAATVGESCRHADRACLLVDGHIGSVGLLFLATLPMDYAAACHRTAGLSLVVVSELAFLSWWYPDTYELNRVLPNLDHHFASIEQALFGCQPALVFSQQVSWGWFSELMCLGYVSYFSLIVLVTLYYFFRRNDEFVKASSVIITSFFVYYVIFVLVPVTGPQFYYPAVGFDTIAAGVFPDLGNWFMTHDFRMAAPGWSDGFFYHLLDVTHDSGERPTAAFPSSHVGITTILFLLALRTRCRWLSGTILFFLILMCFSTVYIFAHYLVDVIAGLVTGVLFYYAFKKVKSEK